MAKKEKKLSRFVNNQFDFILFITVLLLLSIGIIMVLSASSPSSLSETGSSYTYVRKQALFAVAGIVLMFIISKIDYRFYKKFYKIAYIASIVLLVLVLIIGKEVNGSKRWIFITETFSFQPSEAVKFCLIIFYAGILTRDREELKHFVKGWIKHFAWLIPIIGLLLAEPHMSVSIVIIGIVTIMMVIAGCKLWQMIVPGTIIGIPSLIALIILEPYRLSRVTTFLNPWSDELGKGWQVIQSLYAIGSGRFFWSRSWSK